MAEETYEHRLKQIWQQGHRNMAIAFLKRAVSMDSTLAEIAAALDFAQVRDFVDGIHLRDVLMAAPRSVEHVSVRPVAAVAKSDKRRKRRGPSEMKEIKAQLLEMLRAEPGSLDTTQLHESLVKVGHELDRITLSRLLTQLEKEGDITCLGGRPKGWRAVGTRRAGARESGSLGLV